MRYRPVYLKQMTLRLHGIGKIIIVLEIQSVCALRKLTVGFPTFLSVYKDVFLSIGLLFTLKALSECYPGLSFLLMLL